MFIAPLPPTSCCSPYWDVDTKNSDLPQDQQTRSLCCSCRSPNGCKKSFFFCKLTCCCCCCDQDRTRLCSCSPVGNCCGSGCDCCEQDDCGVGTNCRYWNCEDNRCEPCSKCDNSCCDDDCEYQDNCVKCSKRSILGFVPAFVRSTYSYFFTESCCCCGNKSTPSNTYAYCGNDCTNCCDCEEDTSCSCFLNDSSLAARDDLDCIYPSSPCESCCYLPNRMEVVAVEEEVEVEELMSSALVVTEEKSGKQVQRSSFLEAHTVELLVSDDQEIDSDVDDQDMHSHNAGSTPRDYVEDGDLSDGQTTPEATISKEDAGRTPPRMTRRRAITQSPRPRPKSDLEDGVTDLVRRPGEFTRMVRKDKRSGNSDRTSPDNTKKKKTRKDYEFYSINKENFSATFHPPILPPIGRLSGADSAMAAEKRDVSTLKLNAYYFPKEDLEFNCDACGMRCARCFFASFLCCCPTCFGLLLNDDCSCCSSGEKYVEGWYTRLFYYSDYFGNSRGNSDLTKKNEFVSPQDMKLDAAEFSAAAFDHMNSKKITNHRSSKKPTPQAVKLLSSHAENLPHFTLPPNVVNGEADLSFRSRSRLSYIFGLLCNWCCGSASCCCSPYCSNCDYDNHVSDSCCPGCCCADENVGGLEKPGQIRFLVSEKERDEFEKKREEIEKEYEKKFAQNFAVNMEIGADGEVVNSNMSGMSLTSPNDYAYGAPHNEVGIDEKFVDNSRLLSTDINSSAKEVDNSSSDFNSMGVEKTEEELSEDRETYLSHRSKDFVSSVKSESLLYTVGSAFLAAFGLKHRNSDGSYSSNSLVSGFGAASNSPPTVIHLGRLGISYLNEDFWGVQDPESLDPNVHETDNELVWMKKYKNAIARQRLEKRLIEENSSKFFDLRSYAASHFPEPEPTLENFFGMTDRKKQLWVGNSLVHKWAELKVVLGNTETARAYADGRRALWTIENTFRHTEYDQQFSKQFEPLKKIGDLRNAFGQNWEEMIEFVYTLRFQLGRSDSDIIEALKIDETFKKSLLDDNPQTGLDFIYWTDREFSDYTREKVDRYFNVVERGNPKNRRETAEQARVRAQRERNENEGKADILMDERGKVCPFYKYMKYYSFAGQYTQNDQFGSVEHPVVVSVEHMYAPSPDDFSKYGKYVHDLYLPPRWERQHPESQSGSQSSPTSTNAEKTKSPYESFIEGLVHDRLPFNSDDHLTEQEKLDVRMGKTPAAERVKNFLIWKRVQEIFLEYNAAKEALKGTNGEKLTQRERDCEKLLNEQTEKEHEVIMAAREENKEDIDFSRFLWFEKSDLQSDTSDSTPLSPALQLENQNTACGEDKFLLAMPKTISEYNQRLHNDYSSSKEYKRNRKTLSYKLEIVRSLTENLTNLIQKAFIAPSQTSEMKPPLALYGSSAHAILLRMQKACERFTNFEHNRKIEMDEYNKKADLYNRKLFGEMREKNPEYLTKRIEASVLEEILNELKTEHPSHRLIVPEKEDLELPPETSTNASPFNREFFSNMLVSHNLASQLVSKETLKYEESTKYYADLKVFSAQQLAAKSSFALQERPDIINKNIKELELLISENQNNPVKMNELKSKVIWHMEEIDFEEENKILLKYSAFLNYSVGDKINCRLKSYLKR